MPSATVRLEWRISHTINHLPQYQSIPLPDLYSTVYPNKPFRKRNATQLAFTLLRMIVLGSFSLTENSVQQHPREVDLIYQVAEAKAHLEKRWADAIQAGFDRLCATIERLTRKNLKSC